jgi:hypothetical protein
MTALKRLTLRLIRYRWRFRTTGTRRYGMGFPSAVFVPLENRQHKNTTIVPLDLDGRSALTLLLDLTY